MLTLKVLNSDATLNNFTESSSFQTVKGSSIKLILQLFQASKKLRFIPSNTTVITCDFLKSDNTVITKTATFPFPEDKSIIQFSLTSLENTNIIGQNLIVKLTDGSTIEFATLSGGLQIIPLTQGC